MSDKMREEFEVWAKSQRLYVYYIERDDMYSAKTTDTAWWAWQASRAEVVVELPITVCRTHVFELPHTHEVGMEHDEYFEVDDIKKSLDAAGVKYNERN